MDNRFIRKVLCYKYEILIILFSFAYLLPVLNSGYYYDDIFNSTIRGSMINGDASSFKISTDTLGAWFNAGRVFPSSFYCYILFDLCASTPNPLLAYKLFLVITTLMDVLALGVFIKQITGSKKAKLICMLACVLFLQVAVTFYNAIYSFHALLQLTVLFGLLSLVFLVKYLNTKKIRYIIFSIIFFLIALLMYEVGFAFIIPALILPILLCQKKERIKNCLPHAIAAAAVMAVNVYARMKASGGYGGVTVSLSDLSLVSVTFLKQLLGAVPLTQTLFTDGMFTGVMKQPIGFYDIVMLVCFAALAILIVFKERKEDTVFDKRKVWLLITTGLSLWIIPSALISVSDRYQRELVFGTSHLPAYAEYFGVIILLAIIAYWLLSQPGMRWKKYVLVSAFLVAGLPILLINMITMNGFFENTRIYNLVSRNVTQEAIADDFYAAQNENNLLLYDARDNVYTMPNSEIFAAYTDHKIMAQDVNAYIASNTFLQENGYYENSGNEDITVTTEIRLNSTGGVVLKGYLKSIALDAENKSAQSVYVDHVSVYIYDDQEISSIKLIYNTEADNGEVVEKAIELTAEKGLKIGQILTLSEQELVDIKSIRLG